MHDNTPARPGRLVAVVGLDGAGKTTQVVALGEWLSCLGVEVEAIPNQTLAPVRQALTVLAREDGYRDHVDMLGASTMRLISACAKLAYLDRLREQCRSRKGIVLVDRYTVCQYAAARAHGADNEAFLRRLNRGLPTPDLTILLDITPEEALRRINARGIDTETIDFLRAFRAAYQSLPEASGFVTVDGSGKREAVQEALRTVMVAAFPELDQ